jgi:hypothetical protein
MDDWKYCPICGDLIIGQKVHCIFYDPEEIEPVEVWLEVQNGDRVAYKNYFYEIRYGNGYKEPFRYRIDRRFPIIGTPINFSSYVKDVSGK